MHDLVVKLAGVLENNGTDRGRTPPFPELLRAVAWSPKGIERVRPGGIGTVPLVQGRKAEPWDGCRSRVVICGLKGLRPEQFQGRANRLPKLLIIQADTLLRLLDDIAKTVHLTAQIVLALTVRFEFLFHGLTVVCLEVGGKDFFFHFFDA